MGMQLAAIPSGRRCKGKPVGGWGSLGKGLTADECKQACLAEDTCSFATYKKGTCSQFEACKGQKKQAVTQLSFSCMASSFLNLRFACTVRAAMEASTIC